MNNSNNNYELENKLRSYHKDLLESQAELNAKTNGELYIANKYRTTKNKFIYYPMCLKMEAAELIDSLPWKHWKEDNKSYDFDNIKIELIDLLHFALSISIDQRALFIQDIDKKQLSVFDVVKDMFENDIDKKDSYFNEAMYPILIYNVNEELKNSYNNITKNNMELHIGFLHYVDMLMSFRLERNVNCTRMLYETIFIMYGLVKMHEEPLIKQLTLDLYIDEIVNLYYGKLALNKVRQDNGYNEGTYKKMWKLDGVEVEDNVFVTRFISKNKFIKDIDMTDIIAKEYRKQI